MSAPPGKYPSMYERLVANTVESGECWLWTGKTSKAGYPKINIWHEGRTRTVRAHRLMLELVHGWLFPHDEAGHWVCRNPSCIHPHHLRVETAAENLSSRVGYKPCAGSWIPVLYPTAERLLQEAADDAWDGVGATTGPCPF